MTQSEREIAKALDWFAGLLEEKLREAAHYEILGVMQPSPTEWGIHTALNKCADVVKEVRKDMERMIPDA